ncbi:hypothetical protein [Halalkalibacter okhensis]|uniref:hypothetical protein n=1 Tax=Halalkalibacter okhensis TaxID=333138 RepID=UPI000689C141|nr:hypothetical protein [Halalkalibacter okhensis]
MAETLILFILFVPIYGFLIWAYFDTEEAMLFGNRWRYNEEPEFSKEAIALTKFGSVVGFFFLTIILVNSSVIRLILISALFIYIIYKGITVNKNIS